MRRVRWAPVVVALVASLPACSSDGGATVPDVPSSSAVVEPPSDGGQRPEGFTTVTARITDAAGENCDVCMWLADTGDERSRGLMGVTHLGDAVGMAFVFEEPFLGSFYMFQTPTPLSIAWFGSDGGIVGTAEMEPCLDTPVGECPLYAPGDEYDLAIETFAGGLEPLGIGPGARAVLLEGTESDECLLAPR